MFSHTFISFSLQIPKLDDAFAWFDVRMPSKGADGECVDPDCLDNASEDPQTLLSLDAHARSPPKLFALRLRTRFASLWWCVVHFSIKLEMLPQ